MIPDQQELQDFAARYTAAWCSGMPELVAAFFAETGSLQVNNAPPAVGRHDITAIAESFMLSFPDMIVDMEDLRVQNDSIEYHWILTGTNSGPGGTGRKVRINGCERWHIGKDGLIVSSQGNFDEAEYNRQLQQP